MQIDAGICAMPILLATHLHIRFHLLKTFLQCCVIHCQCFQI